MSSHKTFEHNKNHRYDSEYTSLVTVKCKCGHSVTIYNRYRRQLCSHCGRVVFLTKKDEFNYKLKRMLIKWKH